MTNPLIVREQNEAVTMTKSAAIVQLFSFGKGRTLSTPSLFGAASVCRRVPTSSPFSLAYQSSTRIQTSIVCTSITKCEHQKSLFSTARHLNLRFSHQDHEQLLEDPALDAAADPKRHANNNKIACALFDQNGTLTSGHKELTKTQIAEQFDLRYRDLRDIDLRSEGITRILVRPKTLLLQFFDLCMIIQADEALLVNPVRNTSGTAALDHDFEKRLSGLDEAADVPPLPYELRAVEAALVAVLSILREELLAARDDAVASADRLNLESGLAAAELDRIFEHSRRLAKIESKARLVRETIREVLDTDEDLAAMYLTDSLAGKPHDIADHQEAEYMLEAYHKAADALAESAGSVIDVVRRKENTFRSSLAVQRNQIMFLEARIAIHTLGLAAGTLVAGLFGMNLVNYLEEAPWGFPVITAGCVVLSTLFSIYGARRLRRIQSLRGFREFRMGFGHGRERGTGRR
ncbi:hypothetical protein LTR84_003161 [Exophiala bonariae]|uniref:Magnesium transporter n=1 Tax=Exophiala bonariae TaxID=1690606 RepID=A0AAV9NAS2_9EURO|nr:hypothetical protein LTR84_003161 [Exophiala bonariae]